MTLPIGVVQGRLGPPGPSHLQSFPLARWEQEFAAAAAAGLAHIEWIHDSVAGAQNPWWSDSGVARIRDLSDETGVRVDSVCADWFMDHPLATHPDDFAVVLERAAVLGMRYVVLPFVDASSLRVPNGVGLIAPVLREFAPRAGDLGLQLHLETDLDAAALVDLLAAVDHPAVRITYDIGNTASLGYPPVDDLAAYGDAIGSVHVKDRLLGGTTVPLGTGAADVPAVFGTLAAREWSGPIVLQVARGVAGDEVNYLRGVREVVEQLWVDAAS